MPNILDVFNSNQFDLVALTDLVNDFPQQYGTLGALGLFQEEGVNQRTVVIDFDGTTLQLLPKTEWGGPGIANRSGLAASRAYAVPHFPILDSLLAADLQGRRMPGKSDAVQDAQYVLAKKMLEMRRKLEQTLEWMRLGVLKAGLVKDGLGTTILDIYSDFGVTQATVSFALATSTTDILGKVATAKRASIAALRGEISGQFIALCSDTFYDAFVSHANVIKAFQYFQNNGQNLSQDFSAAAGRVNTQGSFNNVRGFEFGGVTFINYTGSVTDSAGNSQLMIDAGSAYLFPMGTSVFRTWFAPADYMETVNTMGLPFYAKQRQMDFDKGIQIECQSNPLPICLKPLVIQKLTLA